MRVFQNAGLYGAYLPRLRQLTKHDIGYDAQISTFLADRFGAAHFLEPVLQRDPTAFFANGDHEATQSLWGKENGLPASASLETILLAQIEHHRTEVFYNLDPMRYGSDFVRKLPGCVRKSFGWRAAPSPGADFEAYDLMLCNFPSILESYRQRGWNAAYFAPAHDTVMDTYAKSTDRPIDVLFVGGYTRHHRRRAELLEAVASGTQGLQVRFHLDNSKLTRLAESVIGRVLPLGPHRRPAAIQTVAREPVFGLSLYEAISASKIVLNGAIDMAGMDRGNMRCFEAMGCGALMLSDSGNYPEGMVSNETIVTYSDTQDAIAKIAEAIANPVRTQQIAKQGWETVSTRYSKSRQWQAFQNLVGAA